MTDAARKRAEAMARALNGDSWDQFGAATQTIMVASSMATASELDAYFAHTRFLRLTPSNMPTHCEEHRFKPEPTDDD